MKRIALVMLAALTFSLPARAQTMKTGTVGVAPITCGAGTVIGAIPADGSTPPCASAGSIPTSQVGTPTAPTLATGGTAGSTTISYVVVGRQSSLSTAGHTPASSTATIATANATLSSTNFVKLTIPPQYGAPCFDIYRTAAGGTPSTTGKIASCVGASYDDIGAAGDSSTAPTTDTTLLLANPQPLPGCAIAVGGPAGPDGLPCTPNAADDEFQEATFTLLAGARTGGWVWANQGSATASVANGWLLLSTPSNAGDSARLLVQSITATAPYTFEAKCAAPNTHANFTVAGMVLRESATGKMVSLGESSNSSSFASFTGVKSSVWTSFTNPSADEATHQQSMMVLYFKMQVSGGNHIESYSTDGINFFQLSSTALTTDFTTAPDQVGLLVDGNGQPSSLSCDFFRRTQ